MSLGTRTARGILTILVLGLAAACREPAPDDVRRTTDSSDPVTGRIGLYADSAAADSVAFRALPPSLRAQLDLRPYLSAARLRDTSIALCQEMGHPSRTEERRRLRLRLGKVDGGHDTTVVLFVRAQRSTGALSRIELVRRPREGLQSGFVWDARNDQLHSIDWEADRGDATSSAPVPRSSPAPRAVRALGRLLLVLPCTGERVALPGERETGKDS